MHDALEMRHALGKPVTVLHLPSHGKYVEKSQNVIL